MAVYFDLNLCFTFLTCCLCFCSYSSRAVQPIKTKSGNTKRTFSKKKVLGKVVHLSKENLELLRGFLRQKECREQFKNKKSSL